MRQKYALATKDVSRGNNEASDLMGIDEYATVVG